VNNFRELKVWQKSIEFTTNVYLITQKYPSEEKFGLISQIRRATISISSNIAEGTGRNSIKEFSHFLSISLASSFELETQLIISNNLSFISSEELDSLLKELLHIQNMIIKLQQSLKYNKVN